KAFALQIRTPLGKDSLPCSARERVFQSRVIAGHGVTTFRTAASGRQRWMRGSASMSSVRNALLAHVVPRVYHLQSPPPDGEWPSCLPCLICLSIFGRRQKGGGEKRSPAPCAVCQAGETGETPKTPLWNRYLAQDRRAPPLLS